MVEIWPEMAVKRQIVSLLTFETPSTKNHNLTIMTEHAVHLAIKHVLPRNSARPKISALFYEKLNTYVSPSVSAHLQLQQLVIHFRRGLHNRITS